MKNENSFLSVEQYMEREGIGKLELIRRITCDEVDVLAHIDSLGVRLNSLSYLWHRPHGEEPIYTNGRAGLLSGFILLLPDQSLKVVRNNSIGITGNISITKIHSIVLDQPDKDVFYGSEIDHVFSIDDALDFYNGKKVKHMGAYQSFLSEIGLYEKSERRFIRIERKEIITREYIIEQLDNLDCFEKKENKSYADYLVLPLERWAKEGTVQETLVSLYGENESFCRRPSGVSYTNMLQVRKHGFFENLGSQILLKKCKNHKVTIDDLCVLKKGSDLFSFDSTDKETISKLEVPTIEKESSDYTPTMIDVANEIELEFWGNYTAEDESTAPVKSQIVDWIIRNYGYTESKAKQIEVIARNERAETGGRRKSKR